MIIILVLLIQSISLNAQVKFRVSEQTKKAAEAIKKNKDSQVKTNPKEKTIPIEFSSDLDGILMINQEFIAIRTNEKVKKNLPENFKYFFFSNDTLIASSELGKKMRNEITQLTTIHIEASVKYKAIIDQLRFIERLDQSFVKLSGGKILSTFQNINSVQEVAAFEISKYEVSVGEFEHFVSRISNGYDDNSKTTKWSQRVKELTCYKKEGLVSTVMNGKFADKRMKVDWKTAADGTALGQDQYTLPVTYVSWLDAKMFCDWLSEIDDRYDYRLSTKEEWIYAATGGVYTYKGSWGKHDELAFQYANLSDKSSLGRYPTLKSEMADSFNDGFAMTCPVDALKPNFFGIYNLSGNVAEWIEPLHSRNEAGVISDFQECIGGSWRKTMRECDVFKTKGSFRKDELHSAIGFRLVRY